MKKVISKPKSWKIKKDIMASGNHLLEAVVALVTMMDIGLSDERFRKYADNNSEIYGWFEYV